MTDLYSSHPIYNTTDPNVIIPRRVEVKRASYSYPMDMNRFSMWNENEIAELTQQVKQHGPETPYPHGYWSSDDFAWGTLMKLAQPGPKGEGPVRPFTYELVLEALAGLKDAVLANGGKSGELSVYDTLPDMTEALSATGQLWQTESVDK